MTLAVAPSAPVAVAPSSGGRDYLSHSAISAYQACPLRYYFRYVAGLPESTLAASLVFGRAMHRAAELHFRELMIGRAPPDHDALLAEYDREWRDVNLSDVQFGRDDDRESLRGLAQRMLATFQASPFARPEGQIIGVEEELRGAIVPGCPDVLGRVDLLIETSADLVVTDLKTTRTRWNEDQVHESAGQLLLYADLARDIAPRKRLRLQFAVLTKTKTPSLDCHEVAADRRQIDRAQRIVERVWRAIEAGHFYPAASPIQCAGCPFREPCREWTG